MGSCFSRDDSARRQQDAGRNENQDGNGAAAQNLQAGNRPLRPKDQLKWTAPDNTTPLMLASQREAFWDTQPTYSGRREIWQALRAACEAESLEMAQVIIDSANIQIPTGNLADGCYDELGNHYIIPLFCYTDPVNLAFATEQPLEPSMTSSAPALPVENRQPEPTAPAAPQTTTSASSIDSRPGPATPQSAPNEPPPSQAESAQPAPLPKPPATAKSPSNTGTITPSSHSKRKHAPAIPTPRAAASPDNSITVTIRLSTNTDIRVSVSRDDTLGDIRAIVDENQKSEPWKEKQQKDRKKIKLRWFIMGKEENEKVYVRDLAVSDNSVMQLFIQGLQ
ncbi:hypothetical protein BJ742DRAFT_786309 [Cladochytrium replicatum]|nr:hypothetical protein BJ742DRAFT_786309 [Cladochytrium replicatum]